MPMPNRPVTEPTGAQRSFRCVGVDWAGKFRLFCNDGRGLDWVTTAPLVLLPGGPGVTGRGRDGQ